MAHIIRLRGAWNREPLHDASGRSVVRFTRQFGCSAGLKAASRTWLSIKQLSRCSAITLNDQPLVLLAVERAEESCGQLWPARFDITGQLQPRNVLAIDVSVHEQTAPASATDFDHLVQLEIE